MDITRSKFPSGTAESNQGMGTKYDKQAKGPNLYHPIFAFSLLQVKTDESDQTFRYETEFSKALKQKLTTGR